MCYAIPVIGWITCISGTAAVAALSFGTAAGVTEGLKVKQYQKQLKKGLDDLQEMKSCFAKMETVIKATIDNVNKKREEILKIESALKDSNSSARDAVEEEKFLDLFFDHLKKELENLTQACKKYFKRKAVKCFTIELVDSLTREQ